MKDDFFEILRVLAEGGVDFALVGGIAANFHGSDLSNMDCDVVVDMGTNNLLRLAKVLSAFSPSSRGTFPTQAFDPSEVMKGAWDAIEMNTASGAFDCHSDIKGLGDFAVCKELSIEVDLGGFTIRVLTREALIVAKKAMGRPKDLLTVAQLEIGGEMEGD